MAVNGIWKYTASSEAAILAGVCILLYCAYKKLHTDEDGKFSRQRVSSILTISISFYTFSVLIVGHLLFTGEVFPKGPTLLEMIEFGFKTDRIAWLLFAVSINELFNLWELIHNGSLEDRDVG